MAWINPKESNVGDVTNPAQSMLDQLAEMQRDKERLDFMERMREADRHHGLKWNAWTYRADQTIREQLDASMKAEDAAGVGAAQNGSQADVTCKGEA